MQPPILGLCPPLEALPNSSFRAEEGLAGWRLPGFLLFLKDLGGGLFGIKPFKSPARFQFWGGELLECCLPPLSLDPQPYPIGHLSPQSPCRSWDTLGPQAPRSLPSLPSDLGTW